MGRALIRRFAPTDAGELTDLLHAGYAELGRAGLNFTAVDQSIETTLVRASAGACWVTESDGALVGTLTISMPPSEALQSMTAAARVPRRAWLNQMATAPDRRGSGIARDLWATGKQWALAQGAASIGVDTAEPATQLVALYRRWGFSSVDTIHWDDKTYDSTVMELAL